MNKFFLAVIALSCAVIAISMKNEQNEQLLLDFNGDDEE